MKYVIIGGSYAAVSAIEGIRSIDKKGTITVLSKEKVKAYCRPVISYVLYGKAKRENLPLRDDSFYKENNVDFRTGCEAMAIDPAKKTVKIKGADDVEYDKLLIATGSSPFVPEMDGLDKVKAKHSFMTIDDMEGVEKATERKGKVLIIGAGLIGLKAAEGILSRCSSMDIVDLAPRILPSILDEETSEIVKKELEAKGITFHLGTSASHFEKNSATLKNGETLEFDTLILAVGVRANTKLFKDAGGEVGRGIKVNERMETSIKDIYSAGDVAESKELTSGEGRVIAIIPSANMEGFTAGVNMAGGDKAFTNDTPMNAIGFFGSHIITSGTYVGTEERVEINGGLRKFFIKDGLLKGFILLGNGTDRGGIYTSLVRNEIPLGTVDWEMLKKSPGLAAFALRSRKEMLSKEV